MSIFGYYFVGSLLREAGWPRKQGVLRREAYDTTIADAAIDQMVDWAASLGAGRPRIALQIIAEMFRDRDWQGEGAPQIEKFITGAGESWDQMPKEAPREIVEPIRLQSAFGMSIILRDFQDSRLRTALEQNVLEALLWGLANPDRFAMWYAGAAQRQQSSLDVMQKAGLATGPLPPLPEFFDQSEAVVRNYEREVGTLPEIPKKLLFDSRGLGVKVADSD